MWLWSHVLCFRYDFCVVFTLSLRRIRSRRTYTKFKIRKITLLNENYGANLHMELTHASKASVVVLLPPPLIVAFLAEEISGDLATSPPFLDLVCAIPLLVV